MIALDIYRYLDEKFVTDQMEDIWFKYMKEIDIYICENFKNRSIGVVCDFAKHINKVYTAVFPTYEVMNKIIEDNVTDAMLFVHHPSCWDIRRKPWFYLMDYQQLNIFKERNISVFCYHVPLDNFSEYSTSVTLAREIGLVDLKKFGLNRGAYNGVIGTYESNSLENLHFKFSKVVNHQTKLYKYGIDEIIGAKVAIVAGGGNDPIFVEELIKEGVNTFITGITSEENTEIHQFERLNNINVIGGTHYSTEKFACQSMCRFFEKMGLESEFVEGVFVVEDM